MLVFLKHGRRRRGRAREKPLFLEENKIQNTTKKPQKLKLVFFRVLRP